MENILSPYPDNIILSDFETVTCMSSGGDGKSKYRDRYAVLQKTYEQRLQSLGELFQKALGEIHADESLAILKQDNVSNDFVTLRVHELVAHALCDEKEHFIRTLTDKLARKEASLKELLRDKETMATQKKALMDELHHVATHVEALQARYTAMSTDTNATDAEVHRLRHENQELIEQLAARDADRAAWDDERRAFSTVQQDLVRLQAEHAKDAAFYTEERSKAAKTIDLLTAKVDDLESNRTKLSADCTALSLAAQEKAIELAHAKDTIDSLRRQCGALQPLEGQMADLKATHQAQVHALEMDLWEARRKYSAVGEQVEGLIHDHDQERALLVESHEKERTAAANELRQRDERSKDLLDASAKQIASLEGQIKERDGVLRDTLQQLEEMEARAAASDVGRGELKVQMTKRVAALEGEVAAVAKEGLAALEKEQQARASVEDQFGAYKRMSELKVQSLMAALQAQKDATKRHEDAEKRMQWQDAAMKKHDALLQAMKSKYETAIAALQTEVVAAQSKAAEAATEFHHKSTRHELNLMQQYQSKVAEAAKQLPGQVVSMTEHKAELDKLEAKLTLQLQTLHRQDQVQWEEAHRHVMDEKVQALEAQLDTWKAQVAVEKQKGDELHAALLAERKHVLDCRAAIDDESIAKTVVVQREAAELRDAVTRHVSTIQQLQQDGRAAHSVAAEREAALQALLKDKADAIAYLQELVRQAEEKHAVATKQTQIDMASKEDSWATQAVDLHARIDALSADNQHHTVENARLIESIKDHAATIRQVQNDLDQTRGDLAAMQRKKHQYKAALIAQKQSMAAAVHAQDEWKHEVDRRAS
ncbi:hypothetical protein DYB32_006077 [Aphanomyces invadans]|uniref:Uncharacterized protein n=1 Tax=Aphanomyces invadans TaxID=157072 RepID=A0A418ASQ7_9STRA|nr:hypothetical protein DYB32_006077 [Aphanomyces invadans]